MPHTAIDLIGDIHGHADELEALLKKLGYTWRQGTYAHPERTVLFVGDYIDRGPKIRETLHLVRSMVEGGHAIALMGNHEYNALCYHTPDGRGGHLRARSWKNTDQHKHTLNAFVDRSEELQDHLAWMLDLPLYHETEHFRAVHACWDPQHIAYLRTRLVNDRLTLALLHEAGDTEGALYTAIEDTLKGKELRLPAGIAFNDKDGHARHDLRIKWWVDPIGATYHELGFPAQDEVPDHPVDPRGLAGVAHYAPTEPPVFFGHYWLAHAPTLQRANVCCLDYSVAKQGKLVAYRFDAEGELQVDKLVHV